MTRIYTRSGDNGETGLIGGARVRKDSTRVDAYGHVDELNAAIGLACSLMKEPREAFQRIQGDLFELGAELAQPKGSPRILAEHVERLEAEIDEMTGRLAELKTFIMPGGSPAGAALHVARGSCRRAERAVVGLAGKETVSEHLLQYLNRLSDHLFTAARDVNAAEGRKETAWPS